MNDEAKLLKAMQKAKVNDVVAICDYHMDKRIQYLQITKINDRIIIIDDRYRYNLDNGNSRHLSYIVIGLYKRKCSISIGE